MTKFSLIIPLLIYFLGMVSAQEKATLVPVENEKTYIIKPFDSISLEVFQEADLSTDSQVSVSGEVTLPLLGTVKILGMTIHEATAKITELYTAEYLISPKVNVTLKTIASETVTIMGAVNQPGELAIPRDTPLDLVSALASVGNFLPNADKNRVMVKRGETTTNYDYNDLVKSNAAQVILRHGDRIDVPVSALANTTVTIIGEVGRAIVTSFPLDGKLNLQTFVGTVGGFTPQADKSRISIERNGKTYSVSLVGNAPSIPLYPGDIITVPKNPLVDKIVTITGQVNRPGSVAFPLSGNFTLLNSIASAGGFSPLADRKKITVTRTVDGKNQVFKINATKITDGKERDFELLPGDSVSISERFF